MAIQLRRGAYANYDATKLQPGEVAVVQSGDPSTSDGKAIYIQTNTGTAGMKQLATTDHLTGLVDNTLTQTGKAADAKATGDAITATNGNMADVFSTSTAYAVGDYCTYNGVLYRFTSAHTAGAWNSSHVTAVTVGDEVSEVKSAITQNDSYFFLLNGFDKTDVQSTNGYWGGTTGALVENNNYVACNKYAKVTAGKKYSLWYNGESTIYHYISYYDLGKNFIRTDSISSSNIVTIPSGAEYVRLSPQRNKSGTFVFCEGETYVGYNAFSYNLSNLIFIPDLVDAERNISEIKDIYSISLLNGFDKDDVTDGGYWSTSDGVTLTTSANYLACNKYVLVKPSTTYSFWDAKETPESTTWQAVAWYDKNKNFISGFVNQSSYTVTSPTGAYYARISFNSSKTYADFIEGSTIDHYHEFGYAINADADYKYPWSDNKLNGIKIDIIGDSWSAVNDTATVKYYDLLESIDNADVKTVAYSGSGFATPTTANKPFYTQAENVRSDSDIVFVLGSFNDVGTIVGGVNIGTKTDTGTTTFCGCINTTIDNILAVNPTAKILFATPMPWNGYNANNESDNANNETALALCKAIEDVCYQRGYECKDMLRCSNLKPWITEFKTAYQPDGTHPNNAGHLKYVYPVVRNYLAAVV